MESSSAVLWLSANCVMRFATATQGRTLLTVRDDFVRQLSPLERAIRLKTDRDVFETEFLAFVAECVREWTLQERVHVVQAVETIRDGLSPFLDHFPETLWLIKTTGQEESDSGYTRGMAVVLPPKKLAYPANRLGGFLAHEFCHLLTRHNPNLRDALYAGIGFYPCGEAPLPEPFRQRKITNPDAPCAMHYIHVVAEGNPVTVVPLIFWQEDCCDVRHYEEYLQHVALQFLAVQQDQGEWKAVHRDGAPVSYSIDQITHFYEQVGRNTKAIQPEEIIAENVALLVTGARDLASPEVVRRIEQVLRLGLLKSGGLPAEQP